MEIAGKYNLSFVLNSCRYQLTGNNRNAFVSPPTPPGERFFGAICSQINKWSISARPKYENVFKILRARIIPSGAEGLRAPEGMPAGIVNFEITDDNNTVYSKIFLRLMKWGEWEDINVDLMPFEKEGFSDEAKKNSLAYNIFYQVTKFNIDDYNIQSAYIGEYVTPVLQLEVKTAGMVNYDSLDDEYTIF